MKFWAGVTDNAWFSFLSPSAPDEVNFWQPRGVATYAALAPGTPFLFKLKRPHHHIAGGGYFVKSTSLPLPRLPAHPDHRPGEAYLRWHNENRFVG